MSAHVDYFPIRAAFPDSWAGRHPRLHFRGLLGLHSRYGPPGCSTAQGGLCHEASIRPVTQPDRSSATRPIDNYLDGFFLHWLSVPFRGTPAIWGTAALAVTHSGRQPMTPRADIAGLVTGPHEARGRIAEAISLWRSHSHLTEKLAAVLFTKFTNCRTTAEGSLRRDVSNKGAFN